MTYRYLWILVLLNCLASQAQTVFIPDVNFRAWLNAAKPNSVDVNGQCDTAVWNAQPPYYLNCALAPLPNGSSLDMQGLQYLKMGMLQFSGGAANSISVQWPGHPFHYEQLVFDGTNVNLFSASPFPIPAEVETFYCNACNITGLPDFGGYWMSIRSVDLSGQTLVVPPTVTLLELNDCNLSEVPLIPNVEELHVNQNPLTSWANIPSNLTTLEAYYVGLSSLPDIASSTTLWTLNLSNNGHTTIPVLPPQLHNLDMSGNQIITLPSLEGTVLTSLDMDNNPLTALPLLPTSLEFLTANSTPITDLPDPLPPVLERLLIAGTSVSYIPTLPASFKWLGIFGAPVSQLPALPAGMTDLDCRGVTALSCLPALPSSLLRLRLSGSSVGCLPNLPLNVDTSFGTLGIAPVVCNVSTSPCPVVSPLITGTTFADADGNGAFDIGEATRPNRTVIAQPGDLLTASDINGNYVLPADIGSFSATGVPGLYEPVTTAPYAVTFTGLGQVDSLNHIGYQVIPDIIDLVTSVIGDNVRPGFNTALWVHVNNVGTEASDATVQLTFDPALDYIISSIAPGSVNGNLVEWTTPTLAPGETWSVRVDLYAPPSLVLGDPLVQTATAAPTLPDETPTDNTAVLNDVVVGSYDPNDKRVEPALLLEQDITVGTRVNYTVRFQNTGTFPAERVLITDTLPDGVQAASMGFIASSHACTWYIHHGVLHVLFNNINLPDSTNDEANSHGFVRFSMRPSSDLLVGAVVANIANIYFDYNAPVITAPAIFHVETGLSVQENDQPGLRMWPNPVTQQVMVEFASGVALEALSVLDLQGRTVLQPLLVPGVRHSVDVAAIAPGTYLLMARTSKGTVTTPFVKQ
ncbi:MAG: T9SS type A sorting domain-containing protein [Flavobacteriales bacterium]